MDINLSTTTNQISPNARGGRTSNSYLQPNRCCFASGEEVLTNKNGVSLLYSLQAKLTNKTLLPWSCLNKYTYPNVDILSSPPNFKLHWQKIAAFGSFYKKIT